MQDTALLDRSIFENLTLGWDPTDPHFPSLEQVVAAARQVEFATMHYVWRE